MTIKIREKRDVRNVYNCIYIFHMPKIAINKGFFVEKGEKVWGKRKSYPQVIHNLWITLRKLKLCE